MIQSIRGRFVDDMLIMCAVDKVACQYLDMQRPSFEFSLCVLVASALAGSWLKHSVHASLLTCSVEYMLAGVDCDWRPSERYRALAYVLRKCRCGRKPDTSWSWPNSHAMPRKGASSSSIELTTV